MDGNTSFIDIADNGTTPVRIAYKWLTSRTVDQETFIKEFIKRDLFVTTDLSKLWWKIKGDKLSKSQMVEYLNSVEGREALKRNDAAKANTMRALRNVLL